MKTRKEIQEILDLLDDHYGKFYVCYLNYKKPYELLFATILSAQCTDERVNIVTEGLFKKYQSLEDFATADIRDLEKDIYSTGFYRNKAKSIKGAAIELLEKHKGQVPKEMEALTSLQGVGRKTANVVRGHLYHIDGIVVDTHVKRISNRLGITKEKDPVKIEFDLMKKIPKDHWLRYNTQIIAHGREICSAKKPKCEICFLKEKCSWVKKN